MADLPAVAALVDAAHQHKEGARGDAVVEHDHQCALQPAQGEEKNAQGHEPHVRHRRIGDQLLHVVLAQGHETAVQDGGDRYGDHQRREIGAGFRGHGQAEAQESIGPHFQEDRCQQDAPGRGGFHVRGRQPGMEREHGNLDGKGERHGQKGPALEAEGVGFGRKLRDGEGTARDVERHHRHQKERAAGQGVKEKLERGIAAFGPAPNGDEQEHGDQHGLPEDVKQHEIQGEEDAHAGRCHEHEAEVKLFDPPADVGPRAQHAQRQQ